MSNLQNLAWISIFLVIVYVFILLVLRSLYFMLIVKADPLKAITPKPIKWFEKRQQRVITHEKLDKIS